MLGKWVNNQKNNYNKRKGTLKGQEKWLCCIQCTKQNLKYATQQLLRTRPLERMEPIE